MRISRSNFPVHVPFVRLVLLVFILLAPNACKKEKTAPVQKTVESAKDSTPAPKETERSIPATPSRTTPLQYRAEKIGGERWLIQLMATLGPEQWDRVLKVNRVDLAHVREGEMLMIPEVLNDDLVISPLPSSVEKIQEIQKILLVSRRVQAFAGYEGGRQVRWGPASTGKKATPTPAGLYHTNWKARERASTVNGEWILPWYFNLANFGGISFHQYELPGYPASHSCIRLLESDAKWIYDWADQWVLSKDGATVIIPGTPVIVFGEYDYRAREAPWKKLAEDSGATLITVQEIEEAVQPFWADLEVQARTRDALAHR
ncbi:MAG: L,D-transpeptidase [Acidobacteriia bacterium]|nr:L,D-transpeptidase [Terriglobia bacterium]